MTRALLALCFVALASCNDGPTTPAIELVDTPGTFTATLVGGGTMQGTASIGPDVTAGRIVRLYPQSPYSDLVLEFQRGVLSEGNTYDFEVGRMSLNSLPGFRTVDATLRPADFLGPYYFAISGYFEVVESGLAGVRGKFDFTGMEGETGSRQRVRGSFWATTVTDP